MRAFGTADRFVTINLYVFVHKKMPGKFIVAQAAAMD